MTPTDFDPRMRISERLGRRLETILRRLRPTAQVFREVQGVRLAMPRQHLLPEIAGRFPNYGQNLVALARALHEPGTRLGFLDIGANIGDSARQVVAAVPAQVWCVEGDPFWVPFLERNLADIEGASILPALLVADSNGESARAVRSGGTTSFRMVDTPSGGTSALAPVLVSDLFGLSPLSVPLRLVKCDTDGHDARLVSALVAADPGPPPVLFFEYDVPMSLAAGDPRPERVWEALAEAGYEEMLVWDNYGEPLGTCAVSGVRDLLGEFERTLLDRRWNYWDVAVVHAGDEAGSAAMRQLAAGWPSYRPFQGPDGR